MPILPASWSQLGQVCHSVGQGKIDNAILVKH